MDRGVNTSLAKVGSVISLVGLASCIVSTTLDYWYYLGVSEGSVTGKVYFGLWELCASGTDGQQGEKDCITWSTVESHANQKGSGLDIGWLHACQAFMIMACILLGLGVMCGFLFAITYKSSRMLMVLGGLGCVIAGSFCIVSAAIFGSKYENGLQNEQTGGSLHAGFYMAVLSAVLAKIGGIVILRNRYVFYSSFP